MVVTHLEYYTVSGKRYHSTFDANSAKCRLIFNILFTSRLCSTLPVKQQLTVTPHLNCVATLPREMVVLKNRDAPELSEANCNVTLSHSNQSLKISSDVRIIFFADKKIFTVATSKTQRITNCMHLQQPRRKTP